MEKEASHNSTLTTIKVKTKGRIYIPTMDNLLKKHNGMV